MKTKKILLLATVALPVFAGSVSAALLGITPGQPLFNYNSGGTTVFDATTGALSVNATALDYTQVGGTALPIYPLATAPAVTMNISLDSTCNLVSGDPGGDDLTVAGDIDLNQDFVPEYSGTLLTGEIISLGLDPASTTVRTTFDARFAITGGALVTAGDYVVGAEVGMILNVEGNNFTGDCLTNWNGGAKGQIGAVEPAIVVPPVATCYDVKKIFVRDGKKNYRHYGRYGKSKSKIKVALSTSCPANFDSTQSLVVLSLDGETFEFPIGSFAKVGNKDKYRAWIGGSPHLAATLNCTKGKFSFIASRADNSQIDNSDGVDVTLVLGDVTATSNVVLQETGHHYWKKGHNNVSYYQNDTPLDCSTTAEAEESDMHEIKIRHKSSGKIYSFQRAKGGYGKSCLVYDATSGDYGSFDTSKLTTVTCGSSDANFEVVSIEHKYNNQSCTLLSEDEEDDDTEDNQND
ncbi:MAG: hypothetical protein GXP22_06560 [Gammaproteobacteria bacterium]|nr:hypothetical protein [Gammaproteobacteria bacterium]